MLDVPLSNKDMYPNNFRPSVKHVLGVLEWFYMLTEKILFQNRGLVFYTYETFIAGIKIHKSITKCKLVWNKICIEWFVRIFIFFFFFILMDFWTSLLFDFSLFALFGFNQFWNALAAKEIFPGVCSIGLPSSGWPRSSPGWESSCVDLQGEVD